MNKKIFITGDCHRRDILSRINKITEYYPGTNLNESAMIFLGDFGINCYQDRSDEKLKKKVDKTGLTSYVVRGNHECRPENLEAAKIIFDEEIKGSVYIEEQYPNIKYLIDGEEYIFNNHSAIVIGGAYSVDMMYRLQNDLPWFPNEQLNENEMRNIGKKVAHKSYDLVLTHTCPISWSPTDLFLSFINQLTVDTTMEKWMDEIKNTFTWGIWCFGHYHKDRAERPQVEMFYEGIEDLDKLWQRWQYYIANGHLEDPHIPKSPNFYMGK